MPSLESPWPVRSRLEEITPHAVDVYIDVVIQLSAVVCCHGNSDTPSKTMLGHLKLEEWVAKQW